MSYCHTNASGVRRAACGMRRASTLKNKYSTFYKTTGPTVIKFHMKHDLTPESQNYKIGSGRMFKMALLLK